METRSESNEGRAAGSTIRTTAATVGKTGDAARSIRWLDRTHVKRIPPVRPPLDDHGAAQALASVSSQGSGQELLESGVVRVPTGGKIIETSALQTTEDARAERRQE